MSGFGNTFNQSGSGFGQSNPFGQSQQSVFGNTTSSAFGQTAPSTFNQTQGSSFGQTQTPPVFGQAQSSGFGGSQNSGSVFGQTSDFPQAQAPTFGQTQSNPFAQSNVFSQNPTGVFGQTNTTTTASSGFGSGSPSFGSATPAGNSTPSTAQSNLFAGASGFGTGTSQFPSQTNTGGFGSDSVFGAKQGFGTTGNFSSSVFGSKDSKVTFGATGTGTTFQSSPFGGSVTTSATTTGSTSVFGGGSTKTVFGSSTRTDNAGFGISTTPSKTSSVFGAPASNTNQMSSTQSSIFGSKQTSAVFGGKAENRNVFGGARKETESSNTFGMTKETQPKNQFGVVNKESDTSKTFGGAKKESESKNMFGGVKKESQSSNIFGGVTKQPSSAFGAQKVTGSSVLFSSSGSTSSSSNNSFGAKTTSSVKTTSENIFRSASSGSSGASVFGKTSSLQSHDLVTEESPGPLTVTSDTSQSTQTKPISSVFGSSKVFGSGSAGGGGFSFSSGKAGGSGQSAADDETGETKPFTAASVFGGSAFGKTSGSVFGGAEKSGTARGFGGKVQQDAEKSDKSTARLFGGENRDTEADRGRKRTIKREDDNSSKRGRSLFTSAVAQAVGGRGTKSDSTQPRPVSSRLGDQKSQSEQDDNDSRGSDSRGSDSRGSTSQRLRRLSSVSEDVTSKTAIVCKGVPVKFNKGAILRKHFSKYGSVSKVFPNINKTSATIHFHDHSSAAEAKTKGRVLAKGIPPLQIFWSSHSPVTGRIPFSSSQRTTDTTRESRRRQRSQWDDDDVDSELTGMAGTEDVQNTISKKVAEPRPSSPSPPKRQRPAASLSPGRSSPTPSTSTATSTTSTTETVSLSSLRSAVARNVHEMARILDQRDKFIREGRTKQVDLATARAFVGSCMDMCPEKERYDREDKRRLSLYEVVPGTENIPGQNPKSDPYRTVKEYSRSSADQDEPLPHELRPMPVLMRTMTYLLTDIADRGTEGKWMDWYGFLWDRTRGIRKEITQQQLISREAVELLEKCARFHVYCSERLCEEDMHVFDTKINNENLTKCLQTLKEMYHDLDTKHGIFCPHEAEFRAYIVLMNLNEGDTLREVQTLRQEVQNSWDIKFAIKIYSALSSNNYVRFFRLVKEASFLSACIIHRYFTQVRLRALQTMIKAFGGKKAQFSLSDMVRILSFDNVDEAASFCRFYGQSIVDSLVVLDRSSFFVPECSYSPCRAINLIESKRMVSVGEVMNGATLPPLEFPEPQCSFDENGRFKINQDVLKYAGSKDRKQLDAPLPEKKPPALIQSTVKCEAPSTAPVTTETTTTSTQSATQEQKQAPVPNEAVKMIAKELFWEVIDEFVAEISQGYVKAVQLYLEAGKKTVEELVVIGTASLIRQVCSEVMEEEKERKHKEAQVELSERRARVSEVICQDLVDEVTQQESSNLATSQMREVHAQLKREREDRCTEALSEKLVEESLCDLVQEISMEVYRVDVIQRREKLEALEKCVKLHRSARFLQVWKKEYAKRVKLRRAMLAFPCAPSNQGIDSQLQNLLPDRRNDRLSERRMYVNQQAMVSIETPMEVEKRNFFMNARYSLMALYRRLMKEKAWQPLDVPEVVGTEMNKVYSRHRDMDCTLQDTTREITWKLVVSLPETVFTTPVCTHINKWVTSKFQRGQVPGHPLMKYKGEVLSLYHSTVEKKGRQPLQIGVCVRSIVGTLDKKEVQKVEEKRLLLGTCGIVFVMSPQDGTKDYWSKATARLAGILHAKPVYPALPLVVVLPEGGDWPVRKRELIERLEVDSFQEDGLVADIHVMSVCCDGGIAGVEANLPQATDQLAESVEWLASHMPEPPELRRARIKDYVEDFLLQEYFGPVLQNLRQKRKQHTLHQPPNTLITLYNCAIDHLSEVASSTSLTTHSCPIAEFVWYHPQEELPPAHWNMSDHLSFLYEEISLLQLPRFKYLNYQSDTWKQVCVDVWAFVQSVVKQSKGKDSVRLVTRIKSLLQKVQEDFNDVCYLVEGEDRCEPTYINMPWTEVIDACISYRLSSLPILDKHSQESPQQDLWVYYEEEELEDFAPPTGWKEAMLNTDAEVGPTVLETVEKAVRRKLVAQTIMEEEEEDDEAEEGEPVTVSMTEGCSQSEPNHSLRTECGTLLSSIQAEKKEADKFEKYLETVLMEGADACMDSGHFIEPVLYTDQDWYIETPFRNRGSPFMNGNKNGNNSLDVIPEHRREEEAEMEEEGFQDETIGGRVNLFQEKLFAHKQDSHLFEERLKFLMNT